MLESGDIFLLKESTNIMRIGIDATFLPRDKRGMGMVVRNFLQGYQKVKSEQDELFFLTFKPHLLEDIKQEVGHLGACSTFKEAPQDLDICWYPWDRADIYLPCAKVLTVHDAVVWKAESGKKVYRDWPKVNREFTQIVTISKYVKGLFEKFFPEVKSDLKVSYNSINNIYYQKATEPQYRDEQKRQQYMDKVTGGAPFLFFVGNAYEENKDLLSLLQALYTLRDEFPHKILIAGNEPKSNISFWKRLFPDEHTKYVQEIKSYLEKLPGRVVYTGQLNPEGMLEPYSYCDCLAAVSRYEGFFLPLIEAMNCQAPIFSVNREPLPEVGGEVPFYYEADNQEDMVEKLRFVLQYRRSAEKQELFAEKIKTGLERAQLFTPEKQAKNMLNIFAQAIEKHKQKQK